MESRYIYIVLEFLATYSTSSLFNIIYPLPCPLILYHSHLDIPLHLLLPLLIIPMSMLNLYFLFVQVAGIAANLVQVALSCLFYLQVYLGDDLEPAVFWALGLLSPCAFAFGVDKVQYSTLYHIIKGFYAHGFNSVSTHL